MSTDRSSADALPVASAAVVATQTNGLLPATGTPTAVVLARPKLEELIENTLFGVLGYLCKAVLTTRDAIRHPRRFARALPTTQYCRPTTYFVIAVFAETWLATTLISLERAVPDNLFDKKNTAEMSRSLGDGAMSGAWSQLLMTLAPTIGVVALFAACLHVFAWKRYARDFHACFEITCYSMAAPMFARCALMLALLPMMAANAGAAIDPVFEGVKNVTMTVVAALQVVPVFLLCLHLRQWTGRLGSAIGLWAKAAACTLVVVAAVGAWSYPLWKDAVHLAK